MFSVLVTVTRFRLTQYDVWMINVIILLTKVWSQDLLIMFTGSFVKLYHFFTENKIHDDDTDETDEDSIFSDDTVHSPNTPNTPKQQTSSTSSHGRYKKHFHQRKLQVS